MSSADSQPTVIMSAPTQDYLMIDEGEPDGRAEQASGPQTAPTFVVESPAEAKLAQEPVQAKPVQAKPLETKPVEAKPVEAKPLEAKPVEAKPLEAKPVFRSSRTHIRM